MVNIIEKIFKLILDSAQNEKLNKQLVTLRERLQDVLKVIKEIGAAESSEKTPQTAKSTDKSADTERQATKTKREEVDKRLALAREETEKTVAQTKKLYEANESAVEVSYDKKKGRKRNVAQVARETSLHKELGESYTKELKAIINEGDEAIEQHKERYDELITLIGEEQKAALNLGKGKNADGTGKGFWRRLMEMSDTDYAELKKQAFDVATKLSDVAFSIKQQESKRKLAADKKAIDAEHKAELKELNTKRERGLISEKKYQQELEKLNEKKAKKEEEAERAEFERDKKRQIAQAWINIAVGIAKAWAQYGCSPFTIPIAVAQTAILTAQGVIQTAFIASQKYAQGGLVALGDGVGVVKGRSHAQGGHRLYLDGTPIGEVEGDELLAIVNKHDTARIGALSAANSVHGRRFASGGLLSSDGYARSGVIAPVSIGHLEAARQVELSRQQQVQQQAMINTIREDTQQQIAAINNRIDTLKVVVLAQDVTNMQADIKKIKVKSSW